MGTKQMGLIKQIWTGWKAEYNRRQKEKSFLQGLAHAPAALQPLVAITGNELNVKHSGHAGDIIYSIPAIYALAEGRRINLYLELNQPNRDFIKGMKHPNGNVMLTQKSVELFAPLIEAQRQFNLCEALNGQPVHYDLTTFRQLPFDYRMGSIARWYFLAFGINADLGKPWLQVPADNSFNNAIVVARSSRYHSPGITYRFLQEYPRVVFVGMKEEFEEMRGMVPHLEYKPVANFLELASVIAGSRLFIGNQSFPFSLAEALKVKRVLEVYNQCPNVVVEGPNGYDFCYQPQFEKIVSRLMGNA